MEAEHHKAKRVAHEKEKEEKVLHKEMGQLEDASYVCYEQGFDEALTQVKHFASGSTVYLSRVDRERKLAKILAKEAPTDRNVQEVVVGATMQLGTKEEEAEGGKPPFTLIYLKFCFSYFVYIFLMM